MSQQFGGDWTEEKLERVRKYLYAYTKILDKKRDKYRIAYIDAFAGTGYRTTTNRHASGEELLLPELADRETRRFLEGSARIALQVTPRFDKYIFIEKDPRRFLELETLRTEFPNVESDIILVNADANSYLQDLCENRNWRSSRALIFLDPYGMQVEWRTIAAIAKTKAVDLWILFPLGIAVNRLLKRDGQIDQAIRESLVRLFGASDWYEVFYRESTTLSLFGEETRVEKVGGFDEIADYFVQRLKAEFPGVAGNPLLLYNSRNVPLYLLCFASANQFAKKAVEIAQQILRG